MRLKAVEATIGTKDTENFAHDLLPIADLHAERHGTDVDRRVRNLVEVLCVQQRKSQGGILSLQLRTSDCKHALGDIAHTELARRAAKAQQPKGNITGAGGKVEDDITGVFRNCASHTPFP